MDYKKLADSDLVVSRIAFGAWAAGGWMWGKTERSEAVAAIRKGIELGMSAIDTAPIYGQGTSEEIVGEAISGIPREKVQLLTKFGMRWDLSRGTLAFNSKDNDGNPIDIYKYSGRDSVIHEVEESLRRLKTDYIDLYQIHWPDVTTPIQETFEAVATLIEQGKVRHAGVCNYSLEQLKEARKYVRIVSNQVPYSMLNRSIEAELVPYCIEENISILAYSPMERGLLTGKIRPGHQFAEGDHRATHRFFTQENIVKTNAFLDKLRPMAEAKGISLSQLVLKWTVERPGITVALTGARNAEQTAANAHAADVQLTKEEISYINTVIPD